MVKYYFINYTYMYKKYLWTYNASIVFKIKCT